MRLILLLSICLLLDTSSGIKASPRQQLETADSLFANNKFTESFQLYDSIFRSGEASEAMLLRMAFIKEGLQDYTQALVYLNHYYKITGDRRAMNKIRETAVSHNLVGYEYSDREFIVHNILLFRNEFIFGCVALLMGLSYWLFRRLRRKDSLVLPLTLQVLVSGLLFLLGNNFYRETKAIISTDKTFLRSAPSAAAEPIEVVEKGHRITILNEQDAWIKIEWEGQEAFLRKGRIEKI